jgi:hypothetical protein
MAGLLTCFLMNGVSPMTLKPEQILELFNNRLAGVGRIKKAPSFFMPMTLVQDFIAMRDQYNFNRIEIWEEYFDAVKKSTFLTKNFTPSLMWLLKSENAFKTLSGQYDDKEEEQQPKQARNLNSEAQRMANDFFEKIIRAGHHGLKEEISKLNMIEVRALELFGRASEILSCSDFQVTDTKFRLKAAFLESLKQS